MYVQVSHEKPEQSENTTPPVLKIVLLSVDLYRVLREDPALFGSPPISNHPPLRPSRPVSRHTIKGFSSALSSTADKKGWPEAHDFLYFRYISIL